MTYLQNLIWVFSLCLLYASCNSEAEPTKGFDQLAYSDSVQQKVVHELGAVRLNIEQSANFHSALFARNVSFQQNLLSQPDLIGETSFEEALAFGAYASDFVYCVSYKQTQFAIEYLDIIVRISGNLGLTGAFDKEELSLLYSENPDVNKSAILTKAYLKASEQLYSEERAALVTVMVVGGWVRGLNIASSFARGRENDDIVRLGIYDKCYSFYTCQRLLQTLNYLPEIARLQVEVSKAEPVIDKVLKNRGEISPEMLDELSDTMQELAFKLKLAKSV
jgi:hypothetical protein